MNTRVQQDNSGWYFLKRGGERAGPYPSAETASAALEQFRRGCEQRLSMRPSLAALSAWARVLREHRRSA